MRTILYFNRHTKSRFKTWLSSLNWPVWQVRLNRTAGLETTCKTATALLVRCLAGAICLVLWHAVAHAAEDLSLERYFSQLRARQLFSLAESYALERLQHKNLSPQQKATYALELSRTYAAHARYTRGDEQSDLWERAAAVIRDLLASQTDLPNRRYLQAQRAFIPAAQGEYLHWQSQLLPGDLNLKARAQAALSKAIGLLSVLETQLSLELRKWKPDAAYELQRDELRTLLANVQLRLAVAYLDRSVLFDDKTPGRVADLEHAEPILSKMSGGKTDAEMTWRSRIALLRCLRLQEERKPFAALIDNLQNRKPAKQYRDKIQAEKSRFWLDLKEPTVAAQELIEYQRAYGPLNSELQFLHLQMFKQLYQIALDKQQPDLAEQIAEQIASAVADLQQSTGGYWSARAQQTVQQIEDQQKYGPQIAALLQDARGSYASGQFAAAVKMYQRAVTIARAAGQQHIAGELAYTAASILVQEQQYRDALELLKVIVEKNLQHKLAPDAHLLYAFCLAQLMQKPSPEQQQMQTAYVKVLQNHLDQFPDHKTTLEARWMLANYLKQTASEQQDVAGYNSALQHYMQLPGQHNHAEEAERAIAGSFAEVLQILDAANQPTDQWERSAIEQLDAITNRYTSKELSLAQAEVLLIAARIRLRRAAALQHQKAVSAMQQVIASASQKTASQKTEQAQQWEALRGAALQLRVLALADQQPEQAIRTLAQLEPQEALQVLRGLSQQAQSNNANVTRVHKEIALRLDLERKYLNQNQHAELDRELAAAYVNTGENQKAMRLYRQLSQQEPDNIKFLKQYGLLLTRCKQIACWKEARTVWRKLERLEKQGAPAWLECRYWVIFATWETGELAEAKKLLGVTKLLYPKLGNEKMRAKYESLHARLNAG